MKQGTCELLDNLLEKDKGLCFLDLYPIFKDIILGISYMHSHFLSHGDIKPANILIIDNLYSLCDYGTGKNLYYEQQLDNNLFFQVGEWSVNGTPNYCDPVMKSELNKNYNDYRYKLKKVHIDLFKNDIYQAGVTIYKIATGKSIAGINNLNYDQQLCYNEIHKLKIPIQMQNLIISMMQHESSDRIPVYSLHSSFIDLTERIINSTSLKILQTLDEDKQLFFEENLKLDYDNHDWFVDYNYLQYVGFEKVWKAAQKYQKVKNQSQQDLSYFSGQQKLDYNKFSTRNQKPRKFSKKQIVLLQQNYLLCSFESRNSADESRIMFNNSYFTVKHKDILTIKLPNYRDIENLEVLDNANNSWVPCKMKGIKNLTYEVSIKDNNETLSLPLNTLKLRKCICFGCVISKKVNMDFGYQKINNEEIQLLTIKSSLINSKQLFNAYDADLNKENSVTNCSNLHDELKKNSVLNGTSTILCPYGMYIPEILTSEEIEERAEDIQKMQAMQNKLDILLSKGLIRMLDCIMVKLNEEHWNSFQTGALKMLQLDSCGISIDQLRFSLVNKEMHENDYSIKFEETPSEKYLENLKTSFTKFSTSQQELHYLNFDVKLKGKKTESVMNQFEDVAILINKYGFRFKKGNFTFIIGMPEEQMEKVQSFTETIRNQMNQYYADWKCEYDFKEYDSCERRENVLQLMITN